MRRTGDCPSSACTPPLRPSHAQDPVRFFVIAACVPLASVPSAQGAHRHAQAAHALTVGLAGFPASCARRDGGHGVSGMGSAAIHRACAGIGGGTVNGPSLDEVQVPARIAAMQADPDQAAVIDMTTPPMYPPEAAQQGIGGQVTLVATVAADGGVREVRVEHAEPAGVFDAVSLEAARTWRFKPAMRDGRPVEGRVRIPISFEVTDGGEDGANG